MSQSWTDTLRGLGRSTGKLAAGSPDTMKAFGSLASAATKDGALDKKTKELMAISISICIRCEGLSLIHISEPTRPY